MEYKIADLEELTGIKAHTIRIWEQRYGILEPRRSGSNIRYYSDDQLRKLLNVVNLLQAGNKISAISKLSDAEINEKIEILEASDDAGVKESILIHQIIDAGLTFDEKKFEKAFSSSILQFGIENTYVNVLYPVLRKLGLLWSVTNLSPAQEHFISNLICQKLFTAIDGLSPATETQERWVLFLPENEYHELGLLMSNFVLRNRGKEVCYLGANVPLSSILKVADVIKPTHYLLFAVKHNQTDAISALLQTFKDDLNDSVLYLCCSEATSGTLKLAKKQHTITSFEAFLALASEK